MENLQDVYIKQLTESNNDLNKAIEIVLNYSNDISIYTLCEEESHDTAQRLDINDYEFIEALDTIKEHLWYHYEREDEWIDKHDRTLPENATIINIENKYGYDKVATNEPIIFEKFNKGVTLTEDRPEILDRLPKMESTDTYEIEYNDGAVQRTQVPNEKEIVTGSELDLMQWMDDNFVDCVLDENDELRSFEAWKEIYDSECDPSGSNVVLRIVRNYKEIYKNEMYDEFQPEEEDLDDEFEEGADIFEARDDMLGDLNALTTFEWDYNESYDNCVIAEEDEEYMEIFVWIIDGRTFYTTRDDQDAKEYNTPKEAFDAADWRSY